MTTADRDRLHALLTDERPVNWVITGDSITHGLVHTQGGRSYPEHLHEIVRGELGRTRDAMITTAISGHRIVQILDDFDRRVAFWAPHVVTLMIGTNDCSTGGVFPIIEPDEFAASLTTFVSRVRDLDAIPVLLTPPSVDAAHAPERARIGAFAEAVREVARAERTILVDMLAAFTRIGNGGVPSALMNDAFHPNAAGHAALALEVATALGLEPEPSRTLTLLRARVAAATFLP
ncbi:SGNH/GDSL hydrolase family protein [Microbacterium resistens]|uniref:SGNH/GDSL hydrolase family protein n=1 Tax=Microbacterium resistens TaxID=156977 RepID=UPI00082EFBAF|nr:SGNH/GDSL hydrolase family protein [Microbacterium resistens]MBW1638311.1 SGNH/GDSL hydrolase family protein [Microbacterium resistens]